MIPKIDWDAFTVSISEDELIEHKARVPQALIESPKLLRQKQEALRQVPSVRAACVCVCVCVRARFSGR
jgi:hypothetical protein